MKTEIEINEHVNDYFVFLCLTSNIYHLQSESDKL